MTAQGTADETLQRLEKEWKEVCGTLDEREKALVNTYIRFLRHIAHVCLEKGWRVWFRPNQWTHWGEGGFGSLLISLPAGEPEPHVDLPSEIQFLTELSDIKKLGEEVTSTTLDRISYQPDRWS
jgi:hypothetical protein